MKEFRFRLKNLEDTVRLAGCLANSLRSGDLLVLCGDLGAGKTTLTQHILSYWGNEHTPSPTFALLHSYELGFTVHHLDLYRLDHINEVHAIGWDELCLDDAVIIVEWLDKFPELYPASYLQISLNYDIEERSASITSAGKRGAELWEELRRCVAASD